MKTCKNCNKEIATTERRDEYYEFAAAEREFDGGEFSSNLQVFPFCKCCEHGVNEAEECCYECYRLEQEVSDDKKVL